MRSKYLWLVAIMALWATGAWAETATMTLTWPAASNAMSYKVMKKVGAGSYAILGTVPAPTLTFADVGNAMGQVYCYQVIASNSGGNADASPEQCVMATELPSSVKALNISVTVVPEEKAQEKK